ncbi:MAG: hypothetical protein LBP31_03055 [Holosporales bacterium]|jgi:hypothetical protein|nr:hypothetical protein [Holosporales bacterium]
MISSIHILRLTTIMLVALCFEKTNAAEQRDITFAASDHNGIEAYVREWFDEGWEWYLAEVKKNPHLCAAVLENIQKWDSEEYKEKRENYFDQFVKPFILQYFEDIRNNGIPNINDIEAKKKSFGTWAKTVSSGLSPILANGWPDDTTTRLYQTFVDYDLHKWIGPWAGPAWDPSKILDPHVN